MIYGKLVVAHGWAVVPAIHQTRVARLQILVNGNQDTGHARQTGRRAVSGRLGKNAQGVRMKRIALMCLLALFSTVANAEYTVKQYRDIKAAGGDAWNKLAAYIVVWHRL